MHLHCCYCTPNTQSDRRDYTHGVFKLTREVRFAIPLDGGAIIAGVNGFSANPPLDGAGMYLAMRVVLSGQLEAQSSYLRNIKEIDTEVRRRAVPLIALQVFDRTYRPEAALRAAWGALSEAWPGTKVESIELLTSPFQSYAMTAQMNAQDTSHNVKPEVKPAMHNNPEWPMMRLSQHFEFSAAHRLHNPQLDESANRATFGKCNNPHGHGHNYEVQVTITGTPDSTGRLISIDQLERIVHANAIDHLDHKHLNVEVPAFASLNPSVENIAMTIYQMLKQPLQMPHAKLASVTVWETPKTWCEYAE